jgi:TRAP transporter T-component
MLALLASWGASSVGGCGWTQKIAVDSMVPVLENTAAAARERSDLEVVGTGFPANLMLLDGLIRTEPDNRDLLELGSYLYFGYALGFVELADARRASTYYAIGRDYGLRALERHSKFRKGNAGTIEEFRAGLQVLRRDDARALAWAGANWARWLSLNLDSPAALATMPRVEALLDRLLELDPEFERGLPHALVGSYDALRPEMFGGDPSRAREEFEAARRISQNRMLLYQVFYAEFYCRQILDEECFVSTLDGVVAAPDTLLPDSRLLNAIAKQRAAALLEKRSDWF